MLLREFNKNYGMERKLVVYGSAELYKREVTEASHLAAPSVNCDADLLPVKAEKLLCEYKAGRAEVMEKADVSIKTGIMMAAVFELIRTGKLSYFTENMIDNGTVRLFVKDTEILRMEGRLETIKDNSEKKLSDLYSIATAYVRKLDELGLYDSCKILREATKLVTEGKISCEYAVLGIYEEAAEKLSEAEKCFWEAFSKGRKTEHIERAGEKIEIKPEKQFFKVYGLHNEIHVVVKDVMARNIPWEQIQIVTSNTNGFYPMVTYLEQLGIPYCLPEGLPESYSYVASIIKKHINNKANFRIDSEGNTQTKELFEGLADQLEKAAGNPKLPNQMIPGMYKKASLCRKAAACYDFEANYHMLARMIEKMLLSGSISEERTEAGAVYIASLRNTEKAFRPYVYLIGFEARNYPGAGTQSPVLLDDEINTLGLPERYQSSYDRAEQQKRLEQILASEAKLITISYSSYDTINMREQNPSAFYQSEKSASGQEEKVFGFSEDDHEKIMEAREWILKK